MTNRVVYPNEPADHSGSEEAACALAHRIEAFWQEQGVKVTARVEQDGGAWHVRSDLSLVTGGAIQLTLRVPEASGRTLKGHKPTLT